MCPGLNYALNFPLKFFRVVLLPLILVNNETAFFVDNLNLGTSVFINYLGTPIDWQAMFRMKNYAILNVLLN